MWFVSTSVRCGCQPGHADWRRVVQPTHRGWFTAIIKVPRIDIAKQGGLDLLGTRPKPFGFSEFWQSETAVPLHGASQHRALVLRWNDVADASHHGRDALSSRRARTCQRSVLTEISEPHCSAFSCSSTSSAGRYQTYRISSHRDGH